GDEGEVRPYLAHGPQAGGVVDLREAVRQAEHRHRRTPLGRVTRCPNDEGRPTGRIELQLEKARADVVTDPVRRARIRIVPDVRVRIGRACCSRLRITLRLT